MKDDLKQEEISSSYSTKRCQLRDYEDLLVRLKNIKMNINTLEKIIFK